MDADEKGLALPPACVSWCQSQDYEALVGGDSARVDLGWRNIRLESRRIPVRLWGRDAAGAQVSGGVAVLRRDDIDGALADEGPADLCVLYRASAPRAAARLGRSGGGAGGDGRDVAGQLLAGACGR